MTEGTRKPDNWLKRVKKTRAGRRRKTKEEEEGRGGERQQAEEVDFG